MNGYYPLDQSGSGDNMMGVMNQDDMNPNMVGGQSLDDIVNQNSKAMRRQSVPMHYSSGRPADLESDMRRVSMLEFSGATPGQLDQFQFDPATAAPNMDSMVGDAFARRNHPYQRRRPSSGDIGIDTRLHNSQPYGNMVPPGSYASPLASTSGLDMGMTSPYVSSGLPMSMDMTDPSLGMMNPGDTTPLNMFSQAQFASPMMGSPIGQDFTDSMQSMPDPGGSAPPGSMDINVGSETPGMTPDIRRRNSQDQSTTPSANSSRPPNGNMPQAQSVGGQSSGTNVSTPYGGPERSRPLAHSGGTMGGPLPWTTPPGNTKLILQNTASH